MEFYRKHFGKKLKEALIQAGKKQFELAEALDVNPASVSNWVSGKDFPDESRMGAICDFLKVEIEYFGFGKPEMSSYELVDLLQGNKDIALLLSKVPKDVLKLLALQNDGYFYSLRRVLEGLEEKKKPKAAKAGNS